MPQPRRFTSWVPRVLDPSGDPFFFTEPATPQLLWLHLDQYSQIPTQGRALFKGTRAQRKEAWGEFSSFISQAKTYFGSAHQEDGSSAALNLYYCFLNLAKAELLLTHKNAILGQRIHHGLSFNPSRAKTMLGDSLLVQEGIFPLLFEKRTGVALPTGTRLPITRLLGNCPEIHWELAELGVARREISLVFQSIVTDGALVWALLNFDIPDSVQAPRSVTRRLIERHFRRVDEPDDLNPTLFATSSRFYVLGDAFYESRDPFPATGSQEDDINAATSRVWKQLAPVLDVATIEHADALLCPSLYKSRLLPMPASLARYALVFYLSSLVRYKPAQLDLRFFPDQAWLMDSFVRQAALPLLVSAASGIRGESLYFRSAAEMRG